MYRFLKATPDMADEIWDNATDAVREELIALARRRDPVKMMRQTITDATDAWAGYDGDELVLIFGVHIRSVISNRADIWMIPAKSITRYKRELLKAVPICLKYWKCAYGLRYVENYIPRGMTMLLRFTERFGFKVSEPEGNGFGGFFHHVELKL